MFEENGKKSSNNYGKVQASQKGKVQKNIRKPNSSDKVVKKQYVSRRQEVYGIVIMMVSILFFLSFFSFVVDKSKKIGEKFIKVFGLFGYKKQRKF